jgi:hypothetical protein
VIIAGTGSETLSDGPSASTYLILPGAQVQISNFHAGVGGSRLDFLGAGTTADITSSASGTVISVGSSSVTLVNVAVSVLSLFDNLLGINAANLAGTASTAALLSPAAAVDDGSSHVRTVSGVSAASAISTQTFVTSVAVSDTSANVAAKLLGLQTLAAGGMLTAITLTDGGTPRLSVTVTQQIAAASVLGKITSAYDLSVSGATATFTGGGAAVTLDGALTVSDPDSGGTLKGATVSIGAGFISGDTLNFTNQNSITGSYNSGTGVLTLSGTTTLANYQTALDSITYSFTPGNGDRTGGGGDTARTIDWVVNDGPANSTTATSTLETMHVAPTVTAGATATYTAGGAAVTLDGVSRCAGGTQTHP